jgi:pyridoxal phosphate enzyme (YggS family)
MTIADNLLSVRQRISVAAERAGRDARDVALVAVTKTVDAGAIEEAVEAGVTDIGENYVQDSLAKHATIGGRIRWHMIGHLQRNKAAQAVRIFDLVQGADSLSLVSELGKRASSIGKVQEVLIEVNISGEESKTGVAPGEALALAANATGVQGVKVLGMMGIAPFTSDEPAIRRSFALLRRLWDELPAANRRWLSMGMTSDFEAAIAEGSNMVRVGTAIFGPRRPRQ